MYTLTLGEAKRVWPHGSAAQAGREDILTEPQAITLRDKINSSFISKVSLCSDFLGSI